MRKRIVIGLLAIVAVGGLAFFLSQPKKESVEWHKREYLAASKGGLMPRILNLWSRIRGVDHYHHSSEDVDRVEKHQQALIELGYLEQSRIILMKRTALDLFFPYSREFAKAAETHKDFVNVTVRDAAAQPNEVMITAPVELMPALKEIIRKADAPETRD
jgi:hypothetical protein